MAQITERDLTTASQWPAIITSGWGKGEVGVVTKDRVSGFGSRWYFVQVRPNGFGYWKVPSNVEEQPDDG